MKIKNRKEIEILNGNCGSLQELYNSKNISLSHTIMNKNSKPHKHVYMEEVYYILRGEAILNVEGKNYPIKKGDTFSIPKGKFHNIQEIKKEIELIVVTNPGYDPKDVFY